MPYLASFNFLVNDPNKITTIQYQVVVSEDAANVFLYVPNLFRSELYEFLHAELAAGGIKQYKIPSVTLDSVTCKIEVKMGIEQAKFFISNLGYAHLISKSRMEGTVANIEALNAQKHPNHVRSESQSASDFDSRSSTPPLVSTSSVFISLPPLSSPEKTVGSPSSTTSSSPGSPLGSVI